MAERKKPKPPTLTKLLGLLEKTYGRVRLPRGETLLDRLLFLVIADGEPITRAELAFKTLQDEFVDWNDVRVSTLAELVGALEPHLSSTAPAKARVLRSSLNQLFDAKHKLSLDDLQEQEPADRRRSLECLSAVDAWILQLLSLLPEGNVSLPDAPHLRRVMKRIGLVERSASPAKVRKRLETLVPEEERLRLVGQLVRVGEEVCTVKSYRCEICCLRSVCREGQSQAPSGRKRAAGGGSPATRQRKGDTSAKPRAGEKRRSSGKRGAVTPKSAKKLKRSSKSSGSAGAGSGVRSKPRSSSKAGPGDKAKSRARGKSESGAPSKAKARSTSKAGSKARSKSPSGAKTKTAGSPAPAKKTDPVGDRRKTATTGPKRAKKRTGRSR